MAPLRLVDSYARCIRRRQAESSAGRRPRPRRSIFSLAVPGLLERRLIFVTGKGGRRQIDGGDRARRAGRAPRAAHDRRRAGQPGPGAPEPSDRAARPSRRFSWASGLFTISVDPQHAMEEYLRVKTGPVGQALGSSRLFQAFAMATPGMRELLSVGKVWELSQHQRRTEDADAYDLVIVDSPAAGHGVGILRTPRTFAEIARVGPIAHQGRAIAATIADPDLHRHPRRRPRPRRCRSTRPCGYGTRSTPSSCRSMR